MTETILLENGHFYGVQALANTLQSLVIKNGLIRAIGTREELESLLPASYRHVDLQGQTVWPGLTDSHLHLELLANRLAAIDCETKTLAECLQRVQKAAETLPKDAWVIGFGWNHNVWQPARYGTAQELDAVCGGRPAVLYAKSLHASWVNSTALRLAGLSDQSADPPGGKLLRDSDGFLSGILLENAMGLVDRIIPPLTSQHLQELLKHAQSHLLAMGITCVHDFDGFDCLEALQTLEANDELQLRVRKNLPGSQIEEVTKRGLHSGLGGEHLTLGALKYFADGALGPQSAAMLEPYEGSTSRGILLIDADEIFAQGKRAAAIGWPLAIHAIGDAAVRAVLDGFELLRNYEREQHLPHLPHRIEHVQLINPQDQARLKALDITASVQPLHATSDMDTAKKYWGERCAYAYAYASLWQQGARLIFGSDAPVESANPFWGLHAAVTRRRSNGEPGPEGWYPQQRLSLTNALTAYTTQPAMACGVSQKFGCIAPGYHADLTVLPCDPFNTDPAELWQIQPILTLIDGKVVFRR